MSARNKQWLVISAILALGTLAVYSRVLWCGFVNYDDATYTGHPLVQQGITLRGITWALTGIHASNWHPLTTISHMLDSQIFGQGPAGPHAINLLLHIANTILLFLTLSRLTKSTWRSAFVAALFAIHPLHVESVAWIAERKDVLSTFFLMLTLWAYVHYAERPAKRGMCVVSLLYAIGLMAKPMLVTLPLVLLLLDYWPLGRLKGGSRSKSGVWPGWSLVVEKWPLLVLAMTAAGVTYCVQHKGGATVALSQVSIVLRFENAAISYVMYLRKMLLPTGLSIFYPFPSTPPPVWKPVLAMLFLAGTTLCALRSAKRHPYVAFGWLWYLVTLVPVIGIVQVGQQAMADRYTYVPLIGIFVVIAWGTPEFLNRAQDTRSSTPLLAVSVAILAILSACTVLQIGYWQNRMTLFTHALNVTSNNFVAHDMVGAVLSEQKKYVEAIGHFKQAIRIRPSDDLAYNNLGNAYTNLGRLDEAVSTYDMAIRMKEGFPLAHFNLGLVYILRGEVDRAITHLQAVKEINSGPRAHLEMFTTNRAENEAEVARARKTLDAKPDSPATMCALAIALAQCGELDEAIAILDRVRQSEITPSELSRRLHAVHTAPPDKKPAKSRTAPKASGDANEHFKRGNELNTQGKRTEAIREFREAVRIQPNLGQAHNNLAVALYFEGKYAEAWVAVNACRKAGTEVHPGFLRALSEKMPDPRK